MVEQKIMAMAKAKVFHDSSLQCNMNSLELFSSRRAKTFSNGLNLSILDSFASSWVLLGVEGLYRDRLKSMQILLSRTQARQDQAKQLRKSRKKFLATTYTLF